MTLAALQRALVVSLLADPWIAEHGAAVVAEDQGDTEAAIDGAMARAGIVAVVVTPGFTVTSHDGDTVAGRADVRAAIYEEPALNRTRAGYCTALQLGERILILSRAWPGATPESLRQEPAGESGVTVTAAISMQIIHDTTE
ncbi:MAG: hypothetical protein GX571_03485 [Lentisphaerae bacterium]|jgi:hypothetical protein|nr:hypothetical protein [Lentisphaerota bacterium]